MHWQMHNADQINIEIGHYQNSEIKWIYIIRTIFPNGFFCIVLIFVENYTFWFKDFWKKANFKAKK